MGRGMHAPFCLRDKKRQRQKKTKQCLVFVTRVGTLCQQRQCMHFDLDVKQVICPKRWIPRVHFTFFRTWIGAGRSWVQFAQFHWKSWLARRRSAIIETAAGKFKVREQVNKLILAYFERLYNFRLPFKVQGCHKFASVLQSRIEQICNNSFTQFKTNSKSWPLRWWCMPNNKIFFVLRQSQCSVSQNSFFSAICVLNSLVCSADIEKRRRAVSEAENLLIKMKHHQAQLFAKAEMLKRKSSSQKEKQVRLINGNSAKLTCNISG